MDADGPPGNSSQNQSEPHFEIHMAHAAVGIGSGGGGGHDLVGITCGGDGRRNAGKDQKRGQEESPADSKKPG